METKRKNFPRFGKEKVSKDGQIKGVLVAKSPKIQNENRTTKGQEATNLLSESKPKSLFEKECLKQIKVMYPNDNKTQIQKLKRVAECLSQFAEKVKVNVTESADVPKIKFKQQQTTK